MAGVLLVNDTEKMLILSEYGYGKRVQFDEFSSHGRATGGQRIYTVGEKTGEIVGCVNVKDGDQIMCLTSQGKSIKLAVDEVPVMGRAAQGVRIVNIERPDFVIGVDRIAPEEPEQQIEGPETLKPDTEGSEAQEPEPLEKEKEGLEAEEPGQDSDDSSREE
jgi:DNA gyrase subunit A